MTHKPIHRYVDGSVYRNARGRHAQPERIEDLGQWQRMMAVVDLEVERLPTEDFVKLMVREMRIRCYRPTTIKSYRGVLASFLRWAGKLPGEVCREHVREYLEYLVDGGSEGNTLTVHLSAIRTLFDKFCFRDITLGLVTPRRRKYVPVVLSRDEVLRLLEAATSRRDTLLLGLMYATGMRVSEVASVRVGDIDFDRKVIAVRQGKGNADRLVVLPDSYHVLLAQIVRRISGEAFLFASEDGRQKRHISPRTIQRVMSRTVSLAGISKNATPHSLRHSFATHSFENGCDIRRIQKVLGHVRLETTTIYVRVAQVGANAPIASPLDSVAGAGKVVGRDDGRVAGRGMHVENTSAVGGKLRPDTRSAGRMRIHCRQFPGERGTRVTIEILQAGGSVFLLGTRACEIRPGFWSLVFPAAEEWNNATVKLNRAQRARVEEAEFYLILQSAILRKVTRTRQMAA